MTKKQFILYDGRATDVEGTNDAAIFDSATTEDEARRSGMDDWEGYDCIWWEYDLIGTELKNGKMRADLPPCEDFTTEAWQV